MGFMSPKPPAPPPLPDPPAAEDLNADVLTEDRLRRQKAAGRQSNIVSSLADQVSDAESNARVSKLLG